MFGIIVINSNTAPQIIKLNEKIAKPRLCQKTFAFKICAFIMICSINLLSNPLIYPNPYSSFKTFLNDSTVNL